MALVAMADNNVSIPVRRDASLYDALSGYQDYVLKGIDNELAVNYGTGTLKVTLSSGGCVICGRHVFNDSNDDVSITLSANDSGYIVVRYDLTQTVGNEALFLAVSSLETGDINGSGTKRDLVLGKYTTGESGVTSYSDLRNFYDYSGTRTITIASTDWSSDGTYTLTDSRITATSNQEFLPPLATSANQDIVKALQSANICDYGQSTGSATIICLGTVPTIDVTMRVIFRGEK